MIWIDGDYNVRDEEGNYMGWLKVYNDTWVFEFDIIDFDARLTAVDMRAIADKLDELNGVGK